MKQLPHMIGLKTCTLLLLLGLLAAQVQAQVTQVWPGDASENGIVNHVDLLYLGRWLGDSGPARDSVSIVWTAHDVLKWLPPQPGRPDPAHADCNGDGTVDLLDLAAIDLNYGQDNQSNLADPTSLGSNTSGAAPLSATLASGPLSGGTTDTLWIMLGDSAQPVDSLLGFATTLTFDSTLVDSAYAIFEGSWLGNPSTDLLTINRYRPGQLDLALTRTDQNNVLNGNGRIAGVVVVMTENLKREVEMVEMELSFSQVLALTAGFAAAPVSVSPLQFPVFEATEPLEALVYPVPAVAGVNIDLLAPRGEEIAGRLLDCQGKLCRSFRFRGSTRLEREGLRSGIYIIELRTDSDTYRKRIVFLE